MDWVAVGYRSELTSWDILAHIRTRVDIRIEITISFWYPITWSMIIVDIVRIFDFPNLLIRRSIGWIWINGFGKSFGALETYDGAWKFRLYSENDFTEDFTPYNLNMFQVNPMINNVRPQTQNRANSHILNIKSNILLLPRFTFPLWTRCSTDQL